MKDKTARNPFCEISCPLVAPNYPKRKHTKACDELYIATLRA